MSMPWDRFKPDEVPEEELPYEPPPEPQPPPVEPPDPTEEYVPPPPKPIPVSEPADVQDLAKHLLSEAMDYAKQVIATSLKGKDVDILHPTVTTVTEQGKALVVADAKSRSWRTLVQGLAFDVFAAILAAVALLSGMDPFKKETWIFFGVLLLKSVTSAVISYFMRLKVTPTIKMPGEKMAVMPIPRPMVSKETKQKLEDQGA